MQEGETSLLREFLKITIRNLKGAGESYSSMWISSRQMLHCLFCKTLKLEFKDKNKTNFNVKNLTLVPIKSGEVASWKNEIVFPSFGVECFEYILKLIEGKEDLKTPNNLASKHEVLFYLWVGFFRNGNELTFNYKEFEKPKTSEEIKEAELNNFSESL